MSEPPRRNWKLLFVILLRTMLTNIPFEKGKWRLAQFIENFVQDKKLFFCVPATVKFGFKMELNLRDFVDRQIFATDTWDEDVARIICDRLRPGDVFIDIGANIGFFSLLAAKCVGADGSVLALEPNPLIFDRLRGNIELNGCGNIQAVCLGASDKQGSAPLYLEGEGHSGSASIRRSPLSVNSIEIQLESIDNLMRAKGLATPTLIKMDIEGAEVLALKGMANLLARGDAPALLIEVSEWSLNELGYTRDDMIDLLAGYGYRETRISPSGYSNYSANRKFTQYDALFEKRQTATPLGG